MLRARFAPSPSGRMHFGNIRTAVASFLVAARTGREWLIRIEDIDTGRSRPEYARLAVEDLRALGMESGQPVVYQSERHSLYEAALEQLVQNDLVYECYCSRADIAAAGSAPHGKPGIYPGTCRNLAEGERETRRKKLIAQGRQAALRLRAPQNLEHSVQDVMLGTISGMLHDFVLRRTDGDWAYQLVVVVDDLDQGIDQVLRGADLAASAPAQAWLSQVLGATIPQYIHIPLVMNQQGQRLAKRDRSVTYPELRQLGWSDSQILLQILETLGWFEARDAALELLSPSQILKRAVQSWSLSDLPRSPVIFSPRRGNPS